MVSGLVTSPCDQLRIFSGEARLMRMASKSAIGFAMSKGLERYKVVLRFPAVIRRRYAAPETSVEFPVSSFLSGPNPLHISLACRTGSTFHTGSLFKTQFAASPGSPTTGDRRLIFLIRCRAQNRLLLSGLDQLHI